MHNLAGYVPDIVSAAAMLLLAAFLLVVDRSQPAARIFAASVALRGLSNLEGFTTVHDRLVAESFFVLEVVTELSVAFLACAFLLVYPRRRRLARARWAWAALAVGLTIPLTLFALHPKWYGALVPAAGGGYEIGRYDWLSLVIDLQWLTYSLIAIVLAIEFRRLKPGALRAGHLLVSTGFGLLGAFYGVLTGYGAITGGGRRDPLFVSDAMWRTDTVITAAFTIVSLGAVIALVGAPGRAAGVRKAALAYLAAIALAVVVLIDDAVITANLRLSSLAIGLLRLLMPLLVTYALVRYQVFELDVKLKWTLKQSTVAAIFVAVFFAVSELAQQLFSETIGPYVGVAATAVLVFAIAPLQRVADRFASAAMPHVKPVAEQSEAERATLYREQARVAWSGGTLTAKDRRILDVARERLGLTHEEAARLERDVSPT